MARLKLILRVQRSIFNRVKAIYISGAGFYTS